MYRPWAGKVKPNKQLFWVNGSLIRIAILLTNKNKKFGPSFGASLIMKIGWVKVIS
jgi:hypothetical protein